MLNFKITEAQKLVFAKGPVVAADTTDLYATFEVNNLFAKNLYSYWNVKGVVTDPYRIKLDLNNSCLIPYEILESLSMPDMYGDIDHLIEVSIASFEEGKEEERITSTTCVLPIYKTEYSGNTSQPSKPEAGGGTITNIITGGAIDKDTKKMNFYNGNNVIFSVSLDELKEFLVSRDGSKMKGNLDLAGFNIKNLAKALSDGDAISLGQSKELFPVKKDLEQKADIVQHKEGTLITTDDSGNAPFADLHLYGKTTQNTTTGKSLVDLSGLEFDDSNYGHTFSKGINASLDALYEFLKANTGKSVVLSMKTSGTPGAVGVVGQIRFYDTTDTKICQISPNIAYTIPELPDDFAKGVIYGSNSGASAKDIMIEFGTVATEWEPYTGGKPSPSSEYQQELESAGNGGSVGVTVAGKNLLDVKGLPVSVTGVSVSVADDGLISMRGTATSSGGRLSGVNITLEPGKYRYQHYNKDGTLRNDGIAGGACLSDGKTLNLFMRSSGYFELTERKTFIFGMNLNKDVTYDESAYSMICFADADYSTYEPYKSVKTLTAQTPNGLPGIPVTNASIATYTDENGQMWCADEIDYSRGVYVRRVGVLTTENAKSVSYGVSSKGIPYLCLYRHKSPIDSFSMSNGYTWIPMQSTGYHGNMRTSEDAHFVYDERFTDEQTANTLLLEMDFKALYILATPIETPLSAGEMAAYEALHTHEPSTTVYNDADAYMEMDYYTPTTPVQMNQGQRYVGKALVVDEHGCVVPNGSFAPALEDETHKGCYYRFVNGEKEWVNPPMILGVEYRTTERWQSKPVYTKAVTLSLSTSGTKSVSLNSALTNIRSVDAVIVDSSGLKHYELRKFLVEGTSFVDTVGSLKINTAALSGYTAYLTAKYIL